MNTQRHVQHLFSDYIDGSLAPATARRVEAHLTDCPVCSRELRQWRAMLQLVSSQARVPCPIDCADAVLHRLGQGAGSGRWSERRRSWFIGPPATWAALAATLVVLLGGSAWLLTARSPISISSHASAVVGHGGRTAANGPYNLPLAPHGSLAAVRADAPDRLDGAFGRNDSLILASDFAETDR